MVVNGSKKTFCYEIYFLRKIAKTVVFIGFFAFFLVFLFSTFCFIALNKLERRRNRGY